MDEDRVLYRGRYLNLIDRDGWEYVERSNCDGVVAVIGITADDEVVLIEQYRPPLGGNVIEFPAGLVSDGPQNESEDFMEAARREFFEETGFRAARFERVVAGPLSTGLSSNTLVLYRAWDLSREGPGGGDETEDIQVHVIARRGVLDWLRNRYRAGTAIDPKVYAGLFCLEHQNDFMCFEEES